MDDRVMQIDEGVRLVRAKTSIPVLRPSAVERPRISELLTAHLVSGTDVRVNATAGSGKTTAVVTAIAEHDLPTAWLTLDRLDAAPGRLLLYIEGALKQAVPALTPTVVDALRRGESLLDTAAFLAESLEGHDLIFVVDDTEKIADQDEACEILDTFVLNLPASVRTILIGREYVHGRFLDPHRGSTLVVEDRMLAVTTDEARQVLAGHGVQDVDAAEAVRSTGGWITGILFESWRYSAHHHGDGGETDPLNGYLSAEIMGGLTPAQQAALIVTSVLEEVTPSRAEALGVTAPGQTLHSLSNLHLPVEFNSSKTSMRCHPRFREYLQNGLAVGDQQRYRSVRRAYGRLLMAERRHEEAVDEFLAAEDPESAAAAAAQVLPAVLERLDFTVAERWLDAIGPTEVHLEARLQAAAIRVACERERYGDGAAYADRLLAGDLDEAILTPVLASTIAWCYFLVSRIEDAFGILQRADDVPEVRMMRFCLGIELLDDPTHYRDRPPECNRPSDGLLARADLAHGQFGRVLESDSRPWAAIDIARVSALRALGRTAEAAQLMEVTPMSSWTAVWTRAELLVDVGQHAKASAVLAEGGEHLRRSGSNLYRMFALLFQVRLALRHERDTKRAHMLLNEVEREPSASRRARIVEQLHLWRGLAALQDGQDEEAVRQLDRAVEVMTTWDRLLFLPTAAVYLAEAMWRLDDVDGADRAADLALAAADRQGSRHMLLHALKEYPAVVSRRLDAEADPDSTWHLLGRAVLDREHITVHPLVPRVVALEFGQQAIEVDGTVIVPKLAKSVELLSFLAQEGGRVSRDRLIANLFESSTDDSASAYFRMARNALRKVLPADASFGLDGRDIVWTDQSLTSESCDLQALALSIPELLPGDQSRVIDSVLDRLEAGELLPSSTSQWVIDRRRRMQLLRLDVLEMGAHGAYEQGDYLRAAHLAGKVLEEDPLREVTWRVSMQVAAALGDRDRVTRLYRQCASALAEIDAAPERSTTTLARRLRGEPLVNG